MALRTGPSVTFYHSYAQNTLAPSMTPPSQSDTHARPTRLNLLRTTTAVLRLADGQQVHGKLQVISVTGGLIGLSSPLNQGSIVKLMFRAETGLIFGTAELLIPISRTLQPFRFLQIGDDDRCRLKAVIQSHMDKNRLEQKSIVWDRVW